MDAIDLLTGDHNRVRGLFAQFKAAEEKKDTATMTTVADRIFEQLDVHTSIEESTFYPQVREASDEIGEVVAEGLEEHAVAKDLIAQCRAGDPGSEEWAAKMSVLIENVEHHAEEEEKEMFPKVRSALRGDRLTHLADELTSAKKSLGAPTAEDTIDLTKAALLEKAREQEIPGRSKMDQEELALTVDPRL
jgi:hemerythrin superfamily protein